MSDTTINVIPPFGAARIRKVIVGIPGPAGPGAQIGTRITGSVANTRLYADGSRNLAGVPFSDRTTLPALTVYSDAPNVFTVDQTINANLNMTGGVQADYFDGDGSSLTNLPASQLVGTVLDGNLSANVALYNATTPFSTLQTFSAGIAPVFARWTEIDLTASPLTGTTNNYTLGGQVGTFYRLATSSNIATITGFSISQQSGRVITLYNAGPYPIILGGSGSSFPNRIDWGNTDGYYVLNPLQTITLIYDGTPSSNFRRWRPYNSSHYLSGLDVVRPTSIWTDNLIRIRDELGAVMLAFSATGDITDVNALSRITPPYTIAEVGKVLGVVDLGGGTFGLSWVDAGTSPPPPAAPSLDFSNATNSMYLPVTM